MIVIGLPQTLNTALQVTVIIAAYNAQATIARAIRSALTEAEVAEVVVVDDASRDETLNVARATDDGSGRLKVIALSVNGGPSRARNEALKASSSPWVTVLDADDFFLPGRLSGLLAYADEADLIADDMWQVSEADIDGPRTALIGPRLTLPIKVSLGDFVRSNITIGKRERAEMGFIKPLMRRSLLDKHSITYQEAMRLGEDYELYTRALAHGAKLIVVPAQGYVSVVRAGSLSARHSENDLMHLRDCDAGLMQIEGLSHQDKAALARHAASIDCRLQWRLLINAVKAKDIAAAAKCFLRPWPVPAYLTAQLWEQFVLRIIKGRRPE